MQLILLNRNVRYIYLIVSHIEHSRYARSNIELLRHQLVLYMCQSKNSVMSYNLIVRIMVPIYILCNFTLANLLLCT